MEDFIFRTFMNNDVIQKVVIFADAFNLNIDGWRPANTEEHPCRIIFNNSGMMVGYIDADVCETFKSVEDDMPFVLFTPLGKIVGNYSIYGESFNYNMEHKDSKMNGLFQIKKGHNNSQYHISSSIDLKDAKRNYIQVSFNKSASNYEMTITKSNVKTAESVSLYYGRDCAKIEHIFYPRCNQKRDLANITLELQTSGNTIPVHYAFLGKDVYEKNISVKNTDSKTSMLEEIDFHSLGEEIAENDFRMNEFMDEVREDLTFLANGITPVSIYDRTAQLCFFGGNQQFKLALMRAQNTKVALTDNLVLKKMRNRAQNRRLY